MAIQNRRGIYSNFDPSKMVEGELAVVLSGDPGSSTGRSLYVCFAPGIVKRIADYEDAEDMINAVTEDIQSSFLQAINGAIDDADAATSTATSAAQTAQTAAQTATTAADTANAAAQEAQSYVLGDISNKTVTFTEAETQEAIQSNESTATLFGKIKKWLSNLKDAAFRYVANNLTTTTEGYVLDARQGTELKSNIDTNASDIADIQTGIIGALGTEIAEDTDLNSLTEVGRYYSPNSARTGTIDNKPIGLPGAAFLLEVDTAGAWYRQTISSGHNTYPIKYVRNFAGTTFSPWNRVMETAVTNSGVVELSGFMCAGYLTGAPKAIYFCIPLPGLKGGVSSGALSGSYVIRDADGGYIGNSAGQTLQSLGTVTVNIMPNCVYIKVDLNTASAYTNNTPIVVNCQANSYLTLS